MGVVWWGGDWGGCGMGGVWLWDGSSWYHRNITITLYHLLISVEYNTHSVPQLLHYLLTYIVALVLNVLYLYINFRWHGYCTIYSRVQFFKYLIHAVLGRVRLAACRKV